MIKRIMHLLLVTIGLVVLGGGLLFVSTTGPEAPVVQAAPAQVAPSATLTETGNITEGGYIVLLALGCGCHFNGPLGGLAGTTEEFFDPNYGVAYPRNITPHPETGIGNFTDAELETVIRTGRRPNGEQLSPAMPYKHFSGIAQDDMLDLIAFLKHGQAPISNTVPARQLFATPPPYTPTVEAPATAPVSGTARGEYIVTVLGDCVSCHGPNLAGTPGFAPNITSDPDYGLGNLTAQQIADMLQTGDRPTITGSVRFDGSPIGSIMAQIIQAATSNWAPADALAVGEYLLTVPAVGNQPPLFASQPVTAVTINNTYVYSANVADADVGDTLTVSASVKPDWLTVGPTQGPPRPTVGTAIVTGTATLTDVGQAPVVLTVSDSSGAMTTQTFSVTVSPVGQSLLPFMVDEPVPADD